MSVSSINGSNTQQITATQQKGKCAKKGAPTPPPQNKAPVKSPPTVTGGLNYNA